MYVVPYLPAFQNPLENHLHHLDLRIICIGLEIEPRKRKIRAFNFVAIFLSKVTIKTCSGKMCTLCTGPDANIRYFLVSHPENCGCHFLDQDSSDLQLAHVIDTLLVRLANLNSKITEKINVKKLM